MVDGHGVPRCGSWCLSHLDGLGGHLVVTGLDRHLLLCPITSPEKEAHAGEEQDCTHGCSNGYADDGSRG